MVDDTAASGRSMPERYDQYLGPLLFEPYALDLVSRLGIAPGDAVLELACGTGILTRHLAARLPLGASLTATDLNEQMLALAQRKIDPVEPVTWQTADDRRLPFDDDWFDTVVCQFGVMFFPDKPAALREVGRVLHPGGIFVFNVWDSFDANPFARIARDVVAGFFVSDPPAFYDMASSLHDTAMVRTILEETGFEDIQFSTEERDARAGSARDVAIGLVAGTPVAHAIGEGATAPADEVIATLTERLAAEFGRGAVALRTRAHIFSARRP